MTAAVSSVPNASRNKRRNAVNNVMLTLTGVCAFITVSMLFIILAYLVYNGGKSINFDFFTKLPLPTGESGGGMGNAILGSAEIIFFATLIGLPIGFLAGVYLAEFGGKGLPFVVRYTCDLLNGVPSIVIGMFAWIVVVAPMHHYSAFAGAVALSVYARPYRRPQHRTVSRRSPARHAGSILRPGCQ